MRKPRGYWTKERCQEEALKYNNRTDFQKKSNGSYMSSHKNGWLDEVCGHMVYKQRPSGYWTKERCRNQSLKYNTIDELRKNGKGLYNSIIKNKWVDELCNHMEYLNKYKFRWDKEKSKIEALKYDNRTDFFKYSKGCYMASNKNNWLNEICSHMKNKGNRYNKCIYVYEFSDNSVYVGLTYNINNRHNSRMSNDKDPVLKHIKKTKIQPIRKQLTDYIYVEDAIKLEEFYVNEYLKNGWNILNKNKTGGLGGGNKYWTKEKCKEESIKYNSRIELKTDNPSLYAIIIRNKWSYELFSHMKLLVKPIGYWTKEKCKIESLKYKTRNDFKINAGGAYNYSRKMGWLDEVCGHMKQLRKPKNKIN